MGRKIRKVPANWEHPKRENGSYQPMFEEYYGDALTEWFKEHQQWEEGTHPDILKDPTLKEKYPFFAMWNGNPPDIEYYQPRKYSEDELTHIQLYEDTSEGTPISPVFKKEEFEKLCEWAAENASTFADFKTSKEKWMQMLSNGNVHHQDGNVIFM